MEELNRRVRLQMTSRGASLMDLPYLVIEEPPRIALMPMIAEAEQVSREGVCATALSCSPQAHRDRQDVRRPP